MSRELLFYAIWECDSTRATEGSRFSLYADKSSFSVLSHEETSNFLGLKLYSQDEVEKIRTESSETKSAKASGRGWIVTGLKGLDPLNIVESDEPPCPPSSDQLAPFFVESVKLEIIHMCDRRILSPVKVRVQRIGQLTAFCKAVFSFEMKPYKGRLGIQ